MKKLTLVIALLAAASLTGVASAAEQARPVRIGGGVSKPWTPPYYLAIVAIPEPTTLGILGIGAAALMMRRRRR